MGGGRGGPPTRPRASRSPSRRIGRGLPRGGGRQPFGGRCHRSGKCDGGLAFSDRTAARRRASRRARTLRRGAGPYSLRRTRSGELPRTPPGRPRTCPPGPRPGALGRGSALDRFHGSSRWCSTRRRPGWLPCWTNPPSPSRGRRSRRARLGEEWLPPWPARFVPLQGKDQLLEVGRRRVVRPFTLSQGRHAPAKPDRTPSPRERSAAHREKTRPARISRDEPREDSAKVSESRSLQIAKRCTASLALSWYLSFARSEKISLWSMTGPVSLVSWLA